jgi:hypothetical protein
VRRFTHYINSYALTLYSLRMSIEILLAIRYPIERIALSLAVSRVRLAGAVCDKIFMVSCFRSTKRRLFLLT